MKDFLQSTTFNRLICTLGILLSALVIFGAGMAVGQRRADFSRRWDANYSGTFLGMHSPFRGAGKMGMRDEMSTSHGAFGEIISVASPIIVVKGANEPEKSVIISTSTAIRKSRDMAGFSDLKVGETVVVIGAPDALGQINASLVRIVPPAMPAQSAPVRQ